MTGWTEDDLRQAGIDPETGRRIKGSTPKKEPRVKGYKPTVVDGVRFDSKAEARFYEHLKEQRDFGGDIEYFLRQVPIHLPGGVVLRVDFMVVEWEGPYNCNGHAKMPRYIDVKGHVTQEFKTKKRIAEATYPIKIEIVRWKGGRWVYE